MYCNHKNSSSDSNRIRTHNQLVRKQTFNHLAKQNSWAVLWVFICTVHLIVCSYHVMCTFQSESTLYSCLTVKKRLAQNRRNIWRLNDTNGIRTHNHLVHEWTLKHLPKLAKWLSYVVIAYLNDAPAPFRVNFTYASDIAPVLCKWFLNIQSAIECRFALKHVRDLIITYKVIAIVICLLMEKKSLSLQSRL